MENSKIEELARILEEIKSKINKGNLLNNDDFTYMLLASVIEDDN